MYVIKDLGEQPHMSAKVIEALLLDHFKDTMDKTEILVQEVEEGTEEFHIISGLS